MHILFKRSFATLSVGFMIFMVLVVSPESALAEKGVFTPSIRAQSTYNDNVHFDKKSDFEWLVTPSFKVDYGQEDWTLSGGGRADVYRYSDLNIYDRENYNIWVGGEKELSETVRINVNASFDYDHTFEDELSQSGTVTTQALRRRYSVSPGLTWGMTEKDNLSLSLPFSETVYTGSDNADSISRGGVLNWSHVLNNERTSLLAQGAYTNYHHNRTDGRTEQDVYNLMGGMSYKPAELIELVAYVGLGHSRSDVTFNTLQDVTSDETYFSFDVSGTYQREKWKFTLGADRQVSPSLDGESTLRTRGRASGEYFFTERFSAYLQSAYYQTKSGGLISESKNRTYYLLPKLMYRWTEDSTISLEYKHTNTKNLITDKEQHQNRTSLRFEYRSPWFF